MFVCTPPLTHREIAVTALEQRHPRLPREADRARPRRRAGDRRGGARAPRRSARSATSSAPSRCSTTLREALAGQELGLLIGIATGPTQSRPWFLDRAQGGGNLLERASHQIDLERAVGGEVVAVQAAATRASRSRRARAATAATSRTRPALVLHFANGGDRLDPDRLDPRRAARQLLARRARQRLLAAPRARSRLHAERPLARPAESQVAMRRHPSDRTRRALPRGGAAPATATRSSARPPTRPGTLAVVLACEEALASGAHRRRCRRRWLTTPALSARAEHVGSLLRPRELLDARAARAAGELEPRGVQARRGSGGPRGRRAAGGGRLRGRHRRRAAPRVLPERAHRRGRRRRGRGHRRLAVGRLALRDASATAASRGRPGLAVTERLRRRRFLASEEFTFLRAATDARRQGHAAEPDAVRQPLGPASARAAAYPRFDDFMADVVAILVDEVRELAPPRLPLRPARRAALPAADRPALARASTRSAAGRSSAGSRTASSSTTRVIDAAPGVTFGFHLCRGNQDSRWLVAGAYDAIAAPIFGRSRPSACCSSTTTSAPAASTRSRRPRRQGRRARARDDQDRPPRDRGRSSRRGSPQAARVIDLERLALGTQCGFATSVVGNRITAEDAAAQARAGRRARPRRVWPGRLTASPPPAPRCVPAAGSPGAPTQRLGADRGKHPPRGTRVDR